MADIDQLLIKAEEMRRKPPYKAVLIELMNVLLFQSTEEVPFHKNTLKSILCCGATVDYQCGRMTQDQYFDRVAIDFKHPRKDVESALLSLRKSTRIDTDLLKTLAVIKAEQYPKISFYAAANLSKDDYAFVSALGFDWSLFDGVHLSWKQRMRKPELQFYRHVLEAIDVEPDEAILVDRVTDNILAALSFGFKDVFRLKDPLSRQIVDTFKFDPSNKGIPLQKQISQALFTLKPASSGKYEDILQSAVARGAQFLDQNAKNFPSLTLTGVPVRENFSQLLILEITGDR
jgi:FMN phosphatase YigB (HAD superfamily)